MDNYLAQDHLLNGLFLPVVCNTISVISSLHVCLGLFEGSLLLVNLFSALICIYLYLEKLKKFKITAKHN